MGISSQGGRGCAGINQGLVLEGGVDQEHHPHLSCFCNSSHQHLGGAYPHPPEGTAWERVVGDPEMREATLWGSSPTPSHAKDRQVCRIEGKG